MTLQDRLENLKKQQDLLKEQFIKVAGAIELLEGIIEDEKKGDGKENKKKKD